MNIETRIAKAHLGQLFRYGRQFFYILINNHTALGAISPNEALKSMVNVSNAKCKWCFDIQAKSVADCLD